MIRPYLHRRQDFKWNWLWDGCIIWHIYCLPFPGIRVHSRFSCCPCCPSFCFCLFVFVLYLVFNVVRVSGLFILHCPFCSLRFIWDLYKRTYRIKYINTTKKKKRTTDNFQMWNPTTTKKEWDNAPWNC